MSYVKEVIKEGVLLKSIEGLRYVEDTYRKIHLNDIFYFTFLLHLESLLISYFIL